MDWNGIGWMGKETYSPLFSVFSTGLFTPGWSPAYLFKVVFVKCVCI